MFVGLHNHTMYSLLDATSKPEDIVSRLKEIGQNTIAITEHGNMYSAILMYKILKEHSMKLIYGCEMYVCDDINVKDKNNKYYHLVVLAKNEMGRQNLNKLVSIASTEGFYYKPRIDFKTLLQHKEGLIILSACMAGELQKALLNNDMELVRNVIEKYKNAFGDDYYLEIQSHNDSVQLQLNRQIVDLAKTYNIKWVATTDSHYVKKEDQKYHTIHVSIGNTREVGETYNDCYVQSEQEVRSILSKVLTPQEVDLAVNNTIEIANKCNVEIPLSAPLIPHVDVSENFKDEMDYLRYLCEEGWKKKGVNLLPEPEQKKRRERLNYELNAVEKMGFAGYFLLVQDYVNLTQKRGPARGSSAGSFISYLLDIVRIDPVKYNLLFERFIDVYAITLLEQGKISPKDLKIPDIDVDFSRNEREYVVEHLKNKYGPNRVVSIGSFQYNWAKGTIKDIGRALNIPFEVTNAMTKKLTNETIEEALNLGVLDEYKDKYPELFEYAQKLAGLPKSFSIHPSGKIIAMNDLTYYAPITMSNGDIALQCDMRDAESLGLVKVDLLGLRTIDVIFDTLQLIGKSWDFIDADKIDLYDENVYKNIFQTANTDGIFQFESEGMKETLQKIKPSSLDDLAVASALYRPGAKKYIDNYARRKDGTEEIQYIHPDLGPILSSTYGIMVYQEQLIEIGRLAQLDNPDILRKATAKKKEELLNEAKPQLERGLKKRGWTDEQIQKLWDDMVDFGKYSFNKSHAYSYAFLAYICAYLKYYYPTEFMCSLLNSYKGKTDKILSCVNSIKNMNIPIRWPKFKEFYKVCTIKDNEIHYGLSLVKHCNDEMVDALNKTKEKELKHFLNILIALKEETDIDSRQLDILVRLDFFEEFGKAQKLLNFISCFNLLYGRRQISKDKISDIFKPIIVKYSTETPKQYKGLDYEKILLELWDIIPDEDLPAYQKIIAQKEYLGYVGYTNPSLDKRYIVVLDLDTKYSPRFVGYCLNNGKTATIKVYRSPRDKRKKDKNIVYFDDLPFKEGNMLYAKKFEVKPKTKKEGDTFVEVEGEKEWWLVDYVVVDV